MLADAMTFHTLLQEANHSLINMIESEDKPAAILSRLTKNLFHCDNRDNSCQKQTSMSSSYSLQISVTSFLTAHQHIKGHYKYHTLRVLQTIFIQLNRHEKVHTGDKLYKWFCEWLHSFLTAHQHIRPYALNVSTKSSYAKEMNKIYIEIRSKIKAI